MQVIATFVFFLAILALFLLNRDKSVQTSKALFIPLLWLLIAGSRNVSEWLQMGSPLDGGDQYIEGNPLDRNLLAGLILLGGIVLFQRRRRVVALLRRNAPILLFFTYCLVSITWSDHPFVGFKRWIRASGDVIMVLVVLSDLDWLAARKRILTWASFLLLPLSILLIRYYPSMGRIYGIHDGTFYWTGVGTTKNELGLICMVFALASASWFLDAFRDKETPHRARQLVVHGIMVLMAVWLIHMADSATSFACFVLGVAVLVLTSWRPLVRTPVLVHLVVGLMLFVSFFALFLSSSSNLVGALGRNSTLTGRSDVWRNVLPLVENPLFGTGYESFWLGTRLEMVKNLVGEDLNQAHNGYIEIYLNLGWVGVILLATIIITGYRNIMRAFRKNPDPARLRLAYFVAALAFNFTEAGFKMRHPVWICFLLAIWAVPDASVSEDRVPDSMDYTDRVAEPRLPRDHVGVQLSRVTSLK